MNRYFSPNPEINFGLPLVPRTRRRGGWYPKYIYVLLLANGGYYVGSTRKLDERLCLHFQQGGCLATRQSRPVSIDAIYEWLDTNKQDDPAFFHLEVYIASLYASHLGARFIRGGLYGGDWRKPIPCDRNSWIAGTREFFASPAGEAVWRHVRAIDLTPLRCYEHLPSRMRLNRRTGLEFHSPHSVFPAETPAELSPKWPIPQRPLPPGSLRCPTPTPSERLAYCRRSRWLSFFDS